MQKIKEVVRLKLELGLGLRQIARSCTQAPLRGPYDGDLIQATVYCILVEEKFGRSRGSLAVRSELYPSSES